jgi:hypothetical protein
MRIEEVKTAPIFKEGMWLLKYNKEQIINAMKNFAYPERTMGGRKPILIKSFSVTRTDKIGGRGEYQYTHPARYGFSQIHGTDMGNHRVTINGEEEYWSDVKQIPTILLRLAAFRIGVKEKHFYTPRFCWETNKQRDKRLKEEEE